MIKWERLIENEKNQFEKMSETDKFIYFLLLQYGSPYGWGEESPTASDCSGAVCIALYAATGLLVRTTADDLFKRVFTHPHPRKGDIRAVFYVTRKGTGTAVHVAGMVDDGVILNSQEPYAQVRRMTDVSDWFHRQGNAVYIRGLDRAALERLAQEGKTRYGLDKDFTHYFEIGGVL